MMKSWKVAEHSALLRMYLAEGPDIESSKTPERGNGETAAERITAAGSGLGNQDRSTGIHLPG